LKPAAVWTAIALVLGAAPALAQTAPVTRGDVTGTFGWAFVHKEVRDPYGGDDWHSSFVGSASTGWFWTDHLKTELDFGAGTESRTYFVKLERIDGRNAQVAVESRSRRRTLGVGQQYQFFHNAWFHPYLAAGANVVWERTTERIDAVYFFDGPSPPRTIDPDGAETATHDVTVRPFLAGGFKAYMTPRAFFRTDLRVAIKSGIDEVLLRFGFGVDF
jgi:hypothetical protein